MSPATSKQEAHSATRDRLKLELKRAAAPGLLYVLLVIAGIAVAADIIGNLTGTKPWNSYTVYRASFTGALKNLLDLTPLEALRAKPVGIVAMGATSHHYLGVDWQLRAVLAWFGALVVPTSVYLESGHFQDGRLADAAAAAALTDLVRALVAMTGHARDQAGPPPLSAAGR